MHDARHSSGGSTWWIRPRALATLVIASAGLAAAIWLPGRNDTAEAAEPRIVFADDFAGSGGSGLDASKWLLGGDPSSARQDGAGRLVLTTPMSTSISFAESSGHAEARIKVRRAADALRAFGVLDQHGQVLRGTVEALDPETVQTFTEDFHTFSIDWSFASVVWSVDGKPVMRSTSAAPELPVTVVLNRAGDEGQRPALLLVDFVRVIVDTAPVPPTGATPSQPEPSQPEPSRPEPSQPATSEPTPAPTSEAPSVPPTLKPTTSPPQPTPTATATKPAPPAKAAAWKPFTKYAVGDLVSYKQVTYRVKEAHTSLPGWEPTALPSLFAKV